MSIQTTLCATLFALPALLVPACGGGLERAANASSPVPWCCDVPLKQTSTQGGNVNTSTATCYQATNGASCPNAHQSGGPPSGYIASLEVTPENGCTLPSTFGMGASWTTIFEPATPLWRGWCVTSNATPLPTGAVSSCIDTYATEYHSSCGFSTLINFDNTDAPQWLSYCLSPSDYTNKDFEGQGAPPYCASGEFNCCYAPTELTTSGQLTTTASAGFSDTGCTPAVCSGTCGTLPDGCGGTINCGTNPNPNACASVGATCGSVQIAGCGGVITEQCGTCPAGESCTSNQCQSPVPALGGGWPMLLALSLLGAGAHSGYKRLRG